MIVMLGEILEPSGFDLKITNKYTEGAIDFDNILPEEGC